MLFYLNISSYHSAIQSAAQTQVPDFNEQPQKLSPLFLLSSEALLLTPAAGKSFPRSTDIWIIWSLSTETAAFLCLPTNNVDSISLELPMNLDISLLYVSLNLNIYLSICWMVAHSYGHYGRNVLLQVLQCIGGLKRIFKRITNILIKSWLLIKITSIKCF